MATKGNFVSNLRLAVVEFLNSVEGIKTADLQWTAEGYAGTITQGDLIGANADLVPADISAAIVSIEAVVALLATGHNTNLIKMKP